MNRLSIIWDHDANDPDGNVGHIAEHGLTPEEVDSVLINPTNPTAVSRSSGNPAVFGWTMTGRYIIVVYEEVMDDPRTVYPITAYEVPPLETEFRQRVVSIE
jgi:hypothetical protein